MNRIATMLDRILKNAMILLMAAMVAAVTWQVLSRYLVGSPSNWTEEVARFLLIWIGLLGGAWAYRARMHLGLDLLAQKLDGVGRKRLQTLSDVLVILFALTVLVGGGAMLMQLAYELNQTTAALGIKVSWIYSVIPITGMLMVFYGVNSLVGGDELPSHHDELEVSGD